MKHPKCKTCGKEHALGGCPEFRQRLNVDFRHEGANAQATVQSGNVTVVGAESGTLIPTVDIPDALSRADVVGRHLLKKAKEWGWPDDGEGAFEYVQRISYAQGLEDGTSRRLPSQAQFNKAEYQRQYMADQRTIKRLGLNCTVKEWREKNAKV